MSFEITTVDKIKWLENLGHANEFDKWFAHNVDVAGYMTAPTAVCDFNGKQYAIAAMSRKVTDFKEFLDYVSEQKDRIYIYQIIFVPNKPMLYTIDEYTFAPKPLEYPIMGESYWKVRYGKVEP